MDALNNEGFNTSIVVIPDAMDPDEFLEAKGKDELIALFKNTISAVEFKLNYYYERINVDNYEDRKNYLESMVKSSCNWMILLIKIIILVNLKKNQDFLKKQFII